MSLFVLSVKNIGGQSALRASKKQCILLNMETNDMALYLDYAATTPMLAKAVQAMLKTCSADGTFGNPSSRSHIFGFAAQEIVEQGRCLIAEAIKADVREIVFTSGATEANNLALKGAARMYRHQGNHLVTSAIEHKSVLDVMRYLEVQEGFEVSYLSPNAEGVITAEILEAALRPDTILVSLMWINNEVGSKNPVADLGRLIKQKSQARFHVDAAQALGKVPIELSSLAIDLLSLSAHKVYGPKGIGALFVRRTPKTRLVACMHGGGQERGMRSGTLSPGLVAAFGVAAEQAVKELSKNVTHWQACKERLWTILQSLPRVQLNGSLSEGSCAILNVSFEGVEGESLMMNVPDIALSSGSACSAQSLEPSYVLKGMGCSEMQAHSSIRFSFGNPLSLEEVQQAGESVVKAVQRLRFISPIWEMLEEGIDLDKVQWSA